MLQSSMKGQSMLGISGSKIKVMSSWKIAPALVHPCGRQVSLTAPIGDWIVVRLHEVRSREQWL